MLPEMPPAPVLATCKASQRTVSHTAAFGGDGVFWSFLDKAARGQKRAKQQVTSWGLTCRDAGGLHVTGHSLRYCHAPSTLISSLLKAPRSSFETSNALPKLPPRGACSRQEAPSMQLFPGGAISTHLPPFLLQPLPWKPLTTQRPRGRGGQGLVPPAQHCHCPPGAGGALLMSGTREWRRAPLNRVAMGRSVASPTAFVAKALQSVHHKPPTVTCTVASALSKHY